MGIKIKTKMKVNEIFYSLQGEGLLAGTPSVFIRLAGCPLRCKWCDTNYASDYNAGDDLSTSQILDTVKKFPSHYIVITGGEPMVAPDLKLRADLPDLLIALKKIKKHITIETAGLLFEPDLPSDLMSISPKLNSSRGHGTLFDAAAVRMLIDNYDYQLKFVVDSEKDITEILQAIKIIGNVDKRKIFLMPQASTRDELLSKSPMVASLCERTGFIFCNRLQVLLWNNQRGK
jgi:7-carboxy-7-deazaguanine synthase